MEKRFSSGYEERAQMAKVLGSNAVFHDPSAASVVGGRGEASSYLAGVARCGRRFQPIATPGLPHDVGLVYIGPFMVHRERTFARTDEAPAA